MIPFQKSLRQVSQAIPEWAKGFDCHHGFLGYIALKGSHH